MKVTQYLLPFLFALVFGFNANAQADVMLLVEGTMLNDANFPVGITIASGDYNRGNYLSLGKTFNTDSTFYAGVGYIVPLRERFNAPKTWLSWGGSVFIQNKTTSNICIDARLFHQSGRYVGSIGGRFGVGKAFGIENRNHIVLAIGYNFGRKVQ